MATRIPNDGDLVRALGFVTMYSAWLEQDVDDVLYALGESSNGWLKWSIGRKIKAASTRLDGRDGAAAQHLLEALRDVERLFERRNEFVHGRIFAGQEREYLKSGRPGVLTREVSFSELRDLADSIFDAIGSLGLLAEELLDHGPDPLTGREDG